MNFAPNDYFELDNRRLINLGFFLVIILSVVFLISIYTTRTTRIHDQNKIAKISLENPFNTISLVAESAIVYDIKNSKIMFEKKPYEVRPLASITKILSAVTALELLPQNTVINIETEFLLEEGDSGLYGDEKWKLSDLLDFSLVASSNDGISAIASAAGAFATHTKDINISNQDFISKMNLRASEIGMTKSKFFNETGLDINESRSGGYSSANDVALLFSYALKKHPEIFEATRHEKIQITSESNIDHNAKNTNTGTNSIPNLIGSKTGYTELAGGNLAVIFDPGIGRPIAIVVLGSTSEGRFTDVSLLAQRTLEYLSQGH